jgi:hypothetical protein
MLLGPAGANTVRISQPGSYAAAVGQFGRCKRCPHIAAAVHARLHTRAIKPITDPAETVVPKGRKPARQHADKGVFTVGNKYYRKVCLIGCPCSSKTWEKFCKIIDNRLYCLREELRTGHGIEPFPDIPHCSCREAAGAVPSPTGPDSGQAVPPWTIPMAYWMRGVGVGSSGRSGPSRKLPSGPLVVFVGGGL